MTQDIFKRKKMSLKEVVVVHIGRLRLLNKERNIKGAEIGVDSGQAETGLD